jgi:hypothetical protein
MTIETMAIAISAVASSMAIMSMYLGRNTAPPRPRHTLTITIEDSTGELARVVTRSSRGVDEVKRDLERLVGRTA